MTVTDQVSSGDRLHLLLCAWRSLARKIDPDRSCLTRRTRARYWLSSATQSLLHRIQRKSYSDALATIVLPAPLLVLGFWRSGTTLLHELLCRDLRFGFPSTYACLNPSHFLLTEHRMCKHHNREVSRPMDNLRYSWSSPQEDEFALLALGAPSAYEALIVPSLLRDIHSLLDLQARPVIDQDLWCATFDYFLKLLTVQQGKTMVLKSPTHGYRMRILQQRFPDARYAIIDRNPYEVFASNLKLWQTLTCRYGLERCSMTEIEEFVLAAYVLHERSVAEGIRHAAPGSVARLCYEDLEKDPIGQMSGLYAELKLGDFEIVLPRLEEYLAKVSGHVRNRFLLSLEQKARVDKVWGQIIEQKEYAWPSAYIALDDNSPTSQSSLLAARQSPTSAS
jgi:omega-hydroxy-beta-dihydromenaquinone-9 sulfotransferase